MENYKCKNSKKLINNEMFNNQLIYTFIQKKYQKLKKKNNEIIIIINKIFQYSDNLNKKK